MQITLWLAHKLHGLCPVQAKHRVKDLALNGHLSDGKRESRPPSDPGFATYDPTCNDIP